MEIVDAKYLISNADYTQCPAPDKPEYAFIGRSNVGKSTLINMLCNRKALAKTSSTPGKTQLINHFEILSDDRRKWYIVDLPGYGYAKVAQRSRRRWEQMIEGYLRNRPNLGCLFVLIDSRHEPQDIDYGFLNKIGKWEVPFALVFTKADKNKPGITEKNVQKFLDGMMSFWEEPPRWFISSAISSEGRKQLLSYLSGLNNAFWSVNN
jgi:GTP-binding protein